MLSAFGLGIRNYRCGILGSRAKVSQLSRCGVTANMPALGAGDSGFESLHLDNPDFLRHFIGALLRHMGTMV